MIKESKVMMLCRAVGVATGSRVICPQNKYGKDTDYDFVLSSEDYNLIQKFKCYPVNTETNAESMNSVTGSTSIKFTDDNGCIVNLIVVNNTGDHLALWENTTKVVTALGKGYDLSLKQTRVNLFEHIMGDLSACKILL